MYNRRKLPHYCNRLTTILDSLGLYRKVMLSFIAMGVSLLLLSKAADCLPEKCRGRGRPVTDTKATGRKNSSFVPKVILAAEAVPGQKHSVAARNFDSAAFQR